MLPPDMKFPAELYHECQELTESLEMIERYLEDFKVAQTFGGSKTHPN